MRLLFPIFSVVPRFLLFCFQFALLSLMVQSLLIGMMAPCLFVHIKGAGAEGRFEALSAWAGLVDGGGTLWRIIGA